jgi:LPS sulfotransferase NodH
VDHLKRRIDEHNVAWQDFFDGCGVDPLKVVYEDLVEDHEGTLCSACSTASGWTCPRASPSRLQG